MGIVSLPFCHSTLKAKKPKVFGYPSELNTLGDHIRAWRMDRGLFQRDVARLVDVTTDTVRNWEKNRSNPDLRALPGVLEFLGYDPLETGQSIAKQLTAVRRARGLSQKEHARILKVDPNTLSRWEQVKRTPQGVLLEKIRHLIDSQIPRRTD
jgi:transcriptional regulator with XRE-family HTH domain